MAAPQSYFVTDAGVALRASDVLAARFKKRPLPVAEVPKGPAENNELAVVRNGKLRPGVLYATKDGSARRLFLPKWSVAKNAQGLDAITITLSTRQLIVEIDAPFPEGEDVAMMGHTLEAKLSYWLIAQSGQRATQETLAFPTISSTSDNEPLRRRLLVTLDDNGHVGRVAKALMTPEQGAELVLTARAEVGVPKPRVLTIDKSATLAISKMDLTKLVKPVSVKTFAVASLRAPLTAKPVVTTAPTGELKPITAIDGRITARPLRRFPVDAPPTPPANPPDDPPEVFDPMDRKRIRRPPFHVDPAVTPPGRPPFTPPVRPPVVPTDVVPTTAACDQTIAMARPRNQYPHIYEGLGGWQLPEGQFLSSVAGLGDGNDVPMWVDTAFPKNFYYLPRRFLLARGDAPPFSPAMLAIFRDTEEEGQAPRAELTLILDPYLDVSDLPRARQRAERWLQTSGQVGPPNMFLLEPSVQQLLWRLPSAAGGPDQVAAAEGATISFKDGIEDTIELGYDELKRLLLNLLSVQLAGVSGSLTYDSPSSPGQVDSLDVHVSFRDVCGRAVSCRLLGPANLGVRVELQNIAESDIVVHPRCAVRVGDAMHSAVLHTPEGGTLPDPTLVAQGGSIEAVLLCDMPNVFLGALGPEDVRVSWQGAPTRDQLLTLVGELMAAPAFAPARAPLTVETLPEMFVAPGRRPLRAIRFELENDVSTELTADGLLREVGVRQPFLLALLDDAGAAALRYRLTNLYADGGEGTPGPWTSWEGGSPLLVGSGPWES